MPGSPPSPGIREVFHARFTDHAYPPHTHDVWTLFIVDDGAIRYDLDGRACGAEPSMVTVLPPHVVHDGRPATSRGFRKRVLYLETSILGEQLIGPAVDRPVVPEERLRGQVSALHDALACADDALEAETRLAYVAERIAASLGTPAAEPSPVATADQAERLRAFLDAHAFEQVTIASAAAAIGATPTQLARSFSTVFGIAAARVRPRATPRGRPRPDPRWAGVGRRGRRGRLLRPGPPVAPLQAVPRNDAGPVPQRQRAGLTAVCRPSPGRLGSSAAGVTIDVMRDPSVPVDPTPPEPAAPAGLPAADDELASARSALDRHAWEEAYERFTGADHQAVLSGADLEALASAAFFTGHADAETEAEERAFKAYQAEGNEIRAGFMALQLGRVYGYKGKLSIATAWVRRAERLLDGSAGELRARLPGPRPERHGPARRGRRNGTRAGRDGGPDRHDVDGCGPPGDGPDRRSGR